MTKSIAIKTYMSTPEYPVENKELMELMKKDKEGYNWMAVECAKQLGVELTER